MRFHGPLTLAQRRDALAGIFGRKLRAVPDEDDAGLPTAYGRQERDYYNRLDDHRAAPQDTFRDPE